jgi:hypothetical protein
MFYALSRAPEESGAGAYIHVLICPCLEEKVQFLDTIKVKNSTEASL